MISPHLPALQVVVPLLAAPLCILLRQPLLCWGFATAVSWFALMISIGLLSHVLEVGPITYHLGGWPPPWGIEYRVDTINAFVLLIVSAISAVVLPFARLSIAAELPDTKAHLFYSMYLLCLTGLLGIAITGDAFNVFVFLEVSSLSSYVLISLGKDRRALTAAYQYLIMGTIGATFYLIGIGLLYAMTGTLNLADLADRISAVSDTRTVHAAFAFIVVGMGLKAAIFPLHLWLPNAYCYAPSVVTAFLAATATKVSIYVLLRLIFTVFGGVFSYELLEIDRILVALALAAMLAASTVAIFQTNAKRLLAWSSIAQVGYMVLGIGIGTVAGLTGGIVHVFNHAMMKGGLFLALGCVFFRTGSVRVADMAGLGQSMPWTMAAFVVGGLSLIGVPLTTGFVSKWLLIQAALEQGHWAFAVIIVLASVLAIAYIWRIVEQAYFHPAPEGAAAVAEAPLSLLLPTWALVLANIYFGLHTSLTVGVAERAALSLLDLAP